MPLTPLVPVASNPAKRTTSSLDLLEDLALAIASDTLVELAVIDNIKYQKSIIHIINSHASKSLIYNIFGTNDYNSGTYPTFSTTTTWKQLLTSDKTLSAVTNDAESLTDDWAWIIIAMKRGVAGGGNDSTAKVRIRARK